MQLENKESLNLKMPSRPTIYREYKPDRALSALVNCFWFYDIGDGADHSFHRVIPDNCVDFLFDFSDDTHGGKILGTGMMTKPVFSSKQRLLGVRFNPEHAYQAFKLPLHQITDFTYELNDISDSWGDLKQVFDRPFSESSLQIISQQLKNCWKNQPTDPRVGQAIKLMSLKDPQISISDVAAEVGVTRQHLVRLFDKFVGISPKKFAKINRVQKIVETVKNSAAPSWVNTALDHGFFDQAHLIKDFKDVTGLSPRAYLLEI